MSDMRRYLIRRTGSGKAEVARGLRWLEMKAALLLYGKGGLYVPDLDKLDAIAPVIGGAQGRALRSDKEIQMGAITVELLTDRSLPAAYQQPILAIWPDDGQLRAIEQLGPEHLCVVEWEERLITEWIADHHPEEDLANTTSSRPPADTSNAVVDVALGELTTGADRDRSKLHPVDRATAINTFKTLLANGEVYVPSEIRTWAANNGWSGGQAKELEELARDILGGRKPQTRGRGELSADAIERWRAKSAASGADE
jgi:hypothetical protein